MVGVAELRIGLSCEKANQKKNLHKGGRKCLNPALMEKLIKDKKKEAGKAPQAVGTALAKARD
jgi:hypothetical protein